MDRFRIKAQTWPGSSDPLQSFSSVVGPGLVHFGLVQSGSWFEEQKIRRGTFQSFHRQASPLCPVLCLVLSSWSQAGDEDPEEALLGRTMCRAGRGELVGPPLSSGSGLRLGSGSGLGLGSGSGALSDVRFFI